jgi:hypothetical protein
MFAPSKGKELWVSNRLELKTKKGRLETCVIIKTWRLCQRFFS